MHSVKWCAKLWNVQNDSKCKYMQGAKSYKCKICEVQNAPVQWAPISIYLIRGCSHITSAAGGGEGVRQMLTIADEGGRGGQPNADHCWRGGEGGSPKSWQLLTRDGWGYNLVHKWVFRQQKICEKETIYVILVLQCIAKTKHRSKTHPSPLKCPVK